MTMRAATRGIIDFGKARLLDPAWWRRCNLLIRTMAADDSQIVLKAAYQYQLGLLSSPQLGADSFDAVKKGAFQSFLDILKSVEPWTNETNLLVDQEIEDLVKLYKETVGDPNDPEFIRKLEQDIAADTARRNSSARTETPEEIIARRTAEKAERRARQRKG